VFSVKVAPRLHKEHLRQPELELRESLQLAVAAENGLESSGVGSWQLADNEGIEPVQLRFESPAVKRSFYVCCTTVTSGMCSYSEILIAPVLKSVTRKRLVESVTD
jgi:hypothetical protein